MRIDVTGECSTAKAIRGYLAKHDFHLTGSHADWTVHIEERDAEEQAAIDGAGGELEQMILRHLRKQTSAAIELHTGRTVSSEREIRLLVPRDEATRKACETAVFRGLLEISQQKPTRWWDAILRRNS